MEFVVRLHEALRAGPHADFHLQTDEYVYDSWAVPKGVPTQPGVKRLAIKTADHTTEGAYTEGRIEEGYGKGVTWIEDEGEYRLTGRTPDFRKVQLMGLIYHGTYYMHHMDGNQWLIWKAS
jgi:bifunctional non-homologous end joining protein LigD